MNLDVDAGRGDRGAGAGGPTVTAGTLHPEALLDLERAGLLPGAERQRLDSHTAVCASCALQRKLAARHRAPERGRVRRRSRARRARAVEAATAQWLWEVNRKLTRGGRPWRWIAAMAPLALATTTALVWLLALR